MNFKPIDARQFQLIKKSGWRHKDGTFAKGFHHTKKTKEKISKGNKGKTLSAECKEKLSVTHLGESNGMYGRTGQSHPKSVAIVCLTNGKEYCSVTETAKELKLNRPSISMVLGGRRSHTGGYQFVYKAK